MWLTNSSLGRKVVMSVTGLFLLLFVTFHVLMNAVALISPRGYNLVCEFLGANWYALIATVILAAGFVFHIIYAFWLTLQNRKARGNDRYAVTTRPKSVEWASQNMLVLGIVVVAFLIVHLVQFWAKMQLVEVMHQVGCETEAAAVVYAADGMHHIANAFGQIWTLPVYVIGLIALWFHMTHGFWSAFQSIGVSNNKWIPRFKTLGNWWSTIVVALFIIQAIVFTCQFAA
jgi:succinate dehydrogenase / fumarate reductase cytochrome b subunit